MTTRTRTQLPLFTTASGGVWVAAAILLALFCVQAAAFATPAPASLSAAGVTIVGAEASSRTLHVRVTYPIGTASVRLWRHGHLSGTAKTADASVAGSVLMDCVVPSSRKSVLLTAQLLNDGGAVIGTRGPLSALTSRFAPTCVRVSLPPNSLVSAGQSFDVAHSRWAAKVAVTLGGASVAASTTPGSDRTSVTLPSGASLPYGRALLRARATNAWGTLDRSIFVWNLEAQFQALDKQILIDLDDFYLYTIVGQSVTGRYPVAIGAPGTRTRVGDWFFGRPVSTPSPGWGPIRIPLYGTRNGHRVFYGYYVHGTSDPSSIGTEASHGCIRMYNSDIWKIVAFSYPGMHVTIRP